MDLTILVLIRSVANEGVDKRKNRPKFVLDKHSCLTVNASGMMTGVRVQPMICTTQAILSNLHEAVLFGGIASLEVEKETINSKSNSNGLFEKREDGSTRK